MTKRNESDITNDELVEWYREWDNGQGKPKSHIERDYLDDTSSNGKFISRLWKERLDIETEMNHPLVVENRLLREQLEGLGETPVV